MDKITVRVKCVASGRHPYAGSVGTLEIRDGEVAGRTVQLCRFRPDGGNDSMKFGGRVLDLTTADRATTLRFQSTNTLWHFEALTPAPRVEPGSETYEISHGDFVMNSFRSIGASHDIFKRYTLSASLAHLAVGEKCLARYGAMILTVKRTR